MSPYQLKQSSNCSYEENINNHKISIKAEHVLGKKAEWTRILGRFERIN